MAIFAGRATGAFGGSIHFEWAPDPDVVAQELILAADRVDDMTQPLLLSREVAIDEHLDHFKNQSGPDGEAWQQWSFSYYPTAVANNIGEILERTMDLEQAMANPAAYPITKDSVFFSSGGLPDYWMWNQEGTGTFSSWGKIDAARAEMASRNVRMDERANWGIGKGSALPARPFVGMSIEAQLKILEIFDLWFDNAVTGVFQRQGKFVLAERAGGQFSGRQIVV